MNYTINAATSGNYVVQLRASNNYTSGSAFHVDLDGAKATASTPVPLTGSWCNFQPVPTVAFPLSSGVHVLRIAADQQYFNVETVDVIRTP